MVLEMVVVVVCRCRRMLYLGARSCCSVAGQSAHEWSVRAGDDPHVSGHALQHDTDAQPRGPLQPEGCCHPSARIHPPRSVRLLALAEILPVLSLRPDVHRDGR